MIFPYRRRSIDRAARQGPRPGGEAPGRPAVTAGGDRGPSAVLPSPRMAYMERLDGTGIWAGPLRYGDPGQIADAAAELDQLGCRALWVPDVGAEVGHGFSWDAWRELAPALNGAG
jgi:hypothetical protein